MEVKKTKKQLNKANQNKIWYQKNKEKYKALLKDWRAKHPNYGRDYMRRFRQTKKMQELFKKRAELGHL